jgi:hypothetical protein
MNTNEFLVIHARLSRMVLAGLFTMTCSSSVFSAEESMFPETAFPELPVADASELDALRGMNGDTRINVQSTQQLEATVSGSSFTAGTINGGSVTFAEHSLDNFSGIGLFNVVTGNNNAVDSAVGVTFNLQ